MAFVEPTALIRSQWANSVTRRMGVRGTAEVGLAVCVFVGLTLDFGDAASVTVVFDSGAGSDVAGVRRTAPCSEAELYLVARSPKDGGRRTCPGNRLRCAPQCMLKGLAMV